MAWTERYMSPAGGGAHDGTSEANAWTLAEFLIAHPTTATSVKLNVISGTYTAAADTTFPDGADETPFLMAGYNVTPGDLWNLGRGVTGTDPLQHTNFPVFDGTALYKWIQGTFSQYTNLNFTHSEVAPTFVPGVASNSEQCRFENTGTGTTAEAVKGSGLSYGIALFNCDCISSSTTSNNIVYNVGRWGVAGCRIWNDTSEIGRGIRIGDLFGYAIGNLIFNVSFGLQVDYGGFYMNNTIYDVQNFFYINSSSKSVFIANNVGYNASGYGIDGGSGGAAVLSNNAFGSYTSGRINTGALGTVMEERDAIVLTADPFRDAASEDFRLNNIAGGGQLCRGVHSLWSGFGDLGVIQTGRFSPGFGKRGGKM